MKRFEVTYLPEAIGFLESIDKKAAEKLIFNISKSQLDNDAKVFKKLINSNIWEFRAEYSIMNTGCLHFGINVKTPW